MSKNNATRIFQKVHCRAYLKKHSDGIRLICTEGGGLPVTRNWWHHPIRVEAFQMQYKDGMWSDVKIADLSSFEGETIEKTYRLRVEEEFDGFLVGVTNITTTGRIGTDMTMVTTDLNGNICECFHLTKETHQEKVGVVYFKNNAKRYVLLDDMRGDQE